MKQILSLLLVSLFLICAVAPAAQADSTAYQFTEESFPKMDGSTSMVPLGQGIASVLLGKSREEVSGLISFNRTTQSFRNLGEGFCDVVIAAEPKQSVFEEMQDSDFPYLLETIASEALVFVVNENNPVNSLTTEQVQGIYSGEITNWKEVGGEDMPIEAFQRNSTAGSQVMMEKLVMQGIPMMEPPTTHVTMEMAGLIEAVRNYDNSANAIGYTVFYYATDMQMAQGLKLLRIDGIAPSVETIQAEQYPFINGYYCCINENAAPDSPERILFDWLVSEEGQNLLRLEGYVPISAPGTAVRSGSDVAVDYTHYAPLGRTEAKFTLFDCPHDYLEPRGDYGLIFPYDGCQLWGSWEDEDWDYWAGKNKGFYNELGQLITDPVYSLIYRSSFDDLENDDYYWIVEQDERSGIVSKDGSFFSGLHYEGVYSLGGMILCTRDYSLGTFDLYDRNFRLVKTERDFVTADYAWLYPNEIQDGRYCGALHSRYAEDYTYAVMDENGRILLESDNYMQLNPDGTCLIYDDDWNVTIHEEDGSLKTFADYDCFSSLYRINDNFWLVVPVGESAIITDKNGTLFEWGFDDYLTYSDDTFCVIRDDTSTLYDAKGRRLLSDIPKDWNYLGDKIFYEHTDTGTIIHKMPEDKTTTIPDEIWGYALKDLFVLTYFDSEQGYIKLMDKNLELLPGDFGSINWITDMYTGENYLLIYDAYGFVGEQRIMSMDAQTEYFRANGEISVQNGNFVVSDDWSYRVYDRDGNVLFCYPYYGMGTGD